MTSRTPIDIVTGFLNGLVRGESAAVMDDIAEAIAYTNVSLPTVQGRRNVKRLFGALDASPVSFNYRMINVAAAEHVVLTERLDEIRLGRFAVQIWVCGRYEVVDGQVSVWRDYFDFFDVAKALVRAVIGTVIPGVTPRLPVPAGAR